MDWNFLRGWFKLQVREIFSLSVAPWNVSACCPTADPRREGIPQLSLCEAAGTNGMVSICHRFPCWWLKDSPWGQATEGTLHPSSSTETGRLLGQQRGSHLGSDVGSRHLLDPSSEFSQARVSNLLTLEYVSSTREHATPALAEDEQLEPMALFHQNHKTSDPLPSTAHEQHPTVTSCRYDAVLTRSVVSDILWPHGL